MCAREDAAVHSSAIAPAAGGTGGLATGGGWEVCRGGWVSEAAASAFLSLARALTPAWPLAFAFALREATNRSVDEDAHVSARNLP